MYDFRCDCRFKKLGCANLTEKGKSNRDHVEMQPTFIEQDSAVTKMAWGLVLVSQQLGSIP